MEAALDTVSLQHLLRTPKKQRQSNLGGGNLGTSLDPFLKAGGLRLVVDTGGALIDEWRRTCGHELVAVFLNRWEPLGVIVPIPAVPPLEYQLSRRLRKLGFHGTIDKLVLRLGVASRDKTVVSDDSDFWDPSTPERRGDPSAPVALLCQAELDVTILLLGALIHMLASAAAPSQA